MISTRLPKFTLKKGYGLNRDYIKNEIFKSIRTTKLGELDKKIKKGKFGNTSLNQTRNHLKAKPDLYVNSSTNPNNNEHKKTNQSNILLLNKFNTTTSESKEKKKNNSSYSTNHNNSKLGTEKTKINSAKPEFSINKKLNDFLQKEKEKNKKYSLFNFPELKMKKPNAQIPYEYFNDFLETFCSEENLLEFKIIPNFMDQQSEINNKMRAIVVNWIIEVHNRFKLLPDTLFLSVIIFDRYMSLVHNIKKKRLQLIGVTSLLLACKYEEIFSPEVRDFVCILDRAYEREDLMEQENEMMKKLKFEVTFPTSLKYYEILRIEFGIGDEYYDYGCFLLELTLLDSRFSNYSQGVIASSVCFMLLKFKDDKNENFYNWIKVSNEEVKNCIVDICFLFDNIEQSEYQAVVKKYKDTFHKIQKIFNF